MRSNWSRTIEEITGPGPLPISSRTPTNSSNLLISFPYSLDSSINNYRKKNGTQPLHKSNTDVVTKYDISWMNLLHDCVIYCIYLWISLIQVGINLSPGLDRWKVEGLSDLVIAGQPKVSPSLNGCGHSIRTWELQGTIHVVYTGKVKERILVHHLLDISKRIDIGEESNKKKG